MTFIDFFAGIGGFRRGLELAGHKCVGYCEYDKFAVQAYRAMHDTEGEWYARDIREVRAADLPKADIWCAGFPCQDISIAGQRQGFRGKRSSLFFAITKLVDDLKKESRPSYLLLENVKNLLSINGGFDFARLLIELDEIGYDVEWSLINSADVVPQNRERVYIVGHLRGGNGWQVFPIGKGAEICDKSEKAGETHRDTVLTLTAKGHSNWTGTFIKQLCNVCPTKTRANPNQGRVYDVSGISPSLNCMGGGNREPRVAVEAYKAGAGVLRLDGDQYNVRKLTPLECFRLQGWEDEYFFRAFFLNKDLARKFNKAYQRHRHNPVRLMKWAFEHQKTSDTQLYKQAGNGVTVPVVQAIAEKMKV